MESLYSRDNLLVLGTSPGEVYSGYDRAARLVRSDWESWGDCRFMVDSANISSEGDIAWFATKGYVKFDLSGLLVRTPAPYGCHGPGGPGVEIQPAAVPV